MCRGHCQGGEDELLAFSRSCSEDVACLDRRILLGGGRVGTAGGSLQGGTEPGWCLCSVLVDCGQAHSEHTASRSPLLQFSGSEHARSRGRAPVTTAVPRALSPSQTLSPDTSSLLPALPSPAPLILLSVSDFDNSGDLI